MADRDQRGDVRFEIWKDERGALQMQIGDDMFGFRLLGPKFIGRSAKLANGRALSRYEIDDLRQWLDRAEANLNDEEDS